MSYIDFEVLDNGDLQLTPTQDGIEFINDEMIDTDRDYWSIMADLFEETACNGSYTHFGAGEANPYVGITDAPCIAEDMDVLDDGKREIVGKLWYFDNYCLEMETETLALGESVIYTLHE